MLRRITRKLAILAVLAGMLSGLAPSMLAVRTAHADEASRSGASTALDRSSAPAPKRSEAAEPEPLTSSDLQVRSAVVPSDALASGTAGTCLFYITSDMRLTVTPADGTSGTLPTGVNASDWPWYRYAAYIRSVSFDPGVKTSSTLKNAFSSASTTDPEYSQLKSIDLANLDMADLRSVYTAFANDTRLGSVSFKGALNADGITDWTSVFFQSGIESIDLTDVGDAATTVHGLFQGCRSLKTAVIPWAMAHVANAGGMFDGCAGLTSLDTSVWRFGSMTNAGRMFRNCSNLAVLDVSGWSMGRVWFANGMFCKCARLTVLDVSEWDVHALQQAANMFQGCSELAVLDVSAWNTASLVYASATFQNCAKLTTLDVADWRMGKVRTISNMFGGCTGLTRLDVSKWKTGGIRDMQGTFAYCTNLAMLDLSSWDTSNTIHLNQMFDNCRNLTDVGDLSAWDTSNVTGMTWMFSNDRRLSRLDVSKWNVRNVLNMTGMFADCVGLSTLDLSGWNTDSLTTTPSMFRNLTVTRIYVGDNWTVDNVTGSDLMFTGCTRLVGDDGKGLAYDASKLTAAYARADGGYMTFKGERTVYHKVTFAALDGKTITTMRVKDGGMATAPSLADTTWLADPNMDFNTDGWGGAITAQGKRQTGRDDYSTSAKRHVDANSTIRVDADADYRNAVAGGALGYHLKRDLDGQSDWSGYGCAKGTVCTDVVWYSTIGYSGTVQGFTQISAWSDFGAAVVHHLQLTQVDPVTHNGIARDGYVFTGWDKDVTKPITGDTVYTARYRPAVYRIRFDGNGSTSGAMSDQLFTYGTPQALTAATFQRDGYSLTGWNTRPDGKGKSFTDKQTVADLLTHENAVGTLYAQWTPTPPVITVVFHSNDGGTDETVKRAWASNNLDMKAIGLPDGWTKKGFAFHGWNLAADGSGVEYKAGESLYGRITTATVDLYADWAGLSSTLPQAGGSTKAPAYGAGLALMVLGAGAWLSAGRRRRMA